MNKVYSFSVNNHVYLCCKTSHQVCIMTLLHHSGGFLKSLLKLRFKWPSLLDSLINWLWGHEKEPRREILLKIIWQRAEKIKGSKIMIWENKSLILNLEDTPNTKILQPLEQFLCHISSPSSVSSSNTTFPLRLRAIPFLQFGVTFLIFYLAIN